MLFLWFMVSMLFAGECQWEAAQFYQSQQDKDLVVSGQGDLIGQQNHFSFNKPIDILTGNYQIKAAQGSFNILSKKLVAEGLEINTAKFIIQAKKALVVVSTLKGHLQDVIYLQKKTKTQIEAKAKKVIWNGEQLTLLEAIYSECPRHQRSWEIYAKSIEIDHKKSHLHFTAPGLRLYGHDLGSMDGKLSMSMKGNGASGWLFPKWKINSRLGFGVGIPYYIVSSKTMDLTITPEVYSKVSFGLTSKIRWLDGEFYWTGVLYAYPFDQTELVSGRYAYSLTMKSHPKSKLSLNVQLSRVFDRDWTRDFSEINRDNQFFIPSYLEASENMPSTQWQFLLRKYQFLNHSVGEKMYAFNQLPYIKIDHQLSDRFSVNFSYGFFYPVGFFSDGVKEGARLRGAINYHHPGDVDIQLSAKALSFLQDQVSPKQLVAPAMNLKWKHEGMHVELDWVGYQDQTGLPIYVDTHQVDEFLKPKWFDDRIPDRSDLTFGVISKWRDFVIDLSSRFAFSQHRICIDPGCKVDWLASHHMLPLIVSINKKDPQVFSFISELIYEKPYVNQIHFVYEKQISPMNFQLKYNWQARSYSLVKEKLISGASALSLGIKMDLNQGWTMGLSPEYTYDGRNKIGYVAELYHQDCCSKFGVIIALKPQIYDQALGFSHRPELSFSYQLGV